MGRKPLKNKTHLTELELKIMNIIWQRRSATVQDIAEAMSEFNFAYTTISTVCRVLESHKILESVKNGKSHIYVPLLQKEDYEAKAVAHVLQSVFANDPAALVKRLIDDDKLSPADLFELNELLQDKFLSSPDSN